MPPVTLTSPVLGKEVGETYTGPEEPWLVAQGYARLSDPDGDEPGVSNTGPADVTPDLDPTLAENRESAPAFEDFRPRDKAMLYEDEDPYPYDFDPDGENDDAPEIAGVEPDEGPEEGGTIVTVTGSGLTGTSSVTFGGVEGTELEVVSDYAVRVVAPAGEAGVVDVEVTNEVGSDAATDVFTYVADTPA